MSSAASLSALDLSLRPSARAHRWAFWLHVLPAALLPLATRAPQWAVPLLLLILLSWAWVRRHRVFGYGPRAIQRILARPDGSWWLIRNDGQGGAASLSADSVVSGDLAVLRWRYDDGGVASRLLTGDEAEPEQLRRLYLRLGLRRTTR